MCEFLGKDIPDTPFPHKNDKVAMAEDVKQRLRAESMDFMRSAAVKLGPWFAGVVIGIVALYRM